MFRSTKRVVLAETASGSSGFITRDNFNTPSSTQPVKDVGTAYSRSTLSRITTKPNTSAIETAASGGGLPASTQVNEVHAAQLMTDVLDGIIAQGTTYGVNSSINKVYADMYYHDSICGSTVDIYSTLPFSEFSLTGIKDAGILAKYQEPLEKMSVATLLPSLSIDYLVMGAFLGSMSWDEERRTFNGLVPHSLDRAELRPVPIFGADPLIDIQIPEDILKTMRSNDPRLEEFKKQIPDELRRVLTNGTTSVNNRQGGRRLGGGGVPLDPNSTIFIPRRALLRDYAGISLFKRALPAWFIEKALIRGTIDQSYKRQRAALHITAGDGTNWVPTKDQLAEIANLFLNIDLDPVGALVVTRSDINVNEVRRGDDYYKWHDAYDCLSTIKFRALGISESFITGDANWSTMDKTLSVMLEGIKNYRSLITKELFYNKLFPAISQENNVLRKRFSSEEVASTNVPPNWYKDADDNWVAEVGSAPSLRDFDGSRYVTPKVQWHKQLLPEADDAYMALLTTLEEKGVPIPLRILSAAGGVKMDTIFDSMSSDIQDRKRLKKYMDALAKFKPKQSDGGEDGMDGGGEEASFNLTTSAPLVAGRGGSIKPRGLGTRDPAPDHLVRVNNTREGRIVHTTKKGAAVLTERLHKEVAASAARIARKENSAINEGYERRRTYSYRKQKVTTDGTETENS